MVKSSSFDSFLVGSAADDRSDLDRLFGLRAIFMGGVFFTSLTLKLFYNCSVVQMAGEIWGTVLKKTKGTQNQLLKLVGVRSLFPRSSFLNSIYVFGLYVHTCACTIR